MKVKIKETFEMVIDVDSLEEAKEMHALGHYELDSEVKKNVEFSVCKGDVYGS